VSQRPRHQYAADLPGDLPQRPTQVPPESSRRTCKQRDAPRPTQIRQIRVGVKFEGRNNAGSSRTPLHHVRRTRTIWQC
jgi:hypothetical protein